MTAKIYGKEQLLLKRTKWQANLGERNNFCQVIYLLTHESDTNIYQLSIVHKMPMVPNSPVFLTNVNLRNGRISGRKHSSMFISLHVQGNIICRFKNNNPESCQYMFLAVNRHAHGRQQVTGRATELPFAFDETM